MSNEVQTFEDFLPADFKLEPQHGKVSPSLWSDLKKKCVGALSKMEPSDPCSFIAQSASASPAVDHLVMIAWATPRL